MTAAELQRIAVRLANAGWCRYWLQWQTPPGTPWLMAIQVYSYRYNSYTDITTLEPLRIEDLESRGFELDYKFNHPYVYTIERTNEDGTPYGE